MQTSRIEIFHSKYNLEMKDNLKSLPSSGAVYGLFAIIDDEPVHCRFAGSTDNLQVAVQRHFEDEDATGLRAFMQGPWIKLLVYEPLSTPAAGPEASAALDEWIGKFQPSCEPDGEYAPEPALAH
jgi:hypothetical protein